jgi:hypothetical protein
MLWDVGVEAEAAVVVEGEGFWEDGFGEEEVVALEETERMVMEVKTTAKECCPNKSIYVLIMMSSRAF